MRHDQWISTAQRLARQSSFWPYKMACVIVRSGKVLSTGVNTDTIAEGKDSRYNMGRGYHAELSAVLAGCNLKGSTAYVAGWTKGNNLVCSKPCDLCELVLTEAGIKEVYYHDKTGKAICIRLM